MARYRRQTDASRKSHLRKVNLPIFGQRPNYRNPAGFLAGIAGPAENTRDRYSGFVAAGPDVKYLMTRTEPEHCKIGLFEEQKSSGELNKNENFIRK